jgi:hypothetical protein
MVPVEKSAMSPPVRTAIDSPRQSWIGAECTVASPVLPSRR